MTLLLPPPGVAGLVEEETLNSYADDDTHFFNGTNVVLNDMENKTPTFLTGFSKIISKQLLTKQIFFLHKQRRTSMKMEVCI